MADKSNRLRSRPRTRYNTFGSLDHELSDKTSPEYCERLKPHYIHPLHEKPMFKNENGDVIIGMKGSELDIDYFMKTSLSYPIKFRKYERDCLGIEIPPGKLHAVDIARLVGEHRPIVAMSVASQKSNVHLNLQKWADYFDHQHLRKELGILNLISLEFTGTSLASQVKSPKIVRQLDWIDHAWPYPIKGHCQGRSKSKFKHKGADSDLHGRPKVQKYCLMSVGGSFTDFHIDFGGTSVWYHLVSGRKVFLLAPPTKAVLEAFQQFTWDSTLYLPDLLPPATFSRCDLSAGETLFIPSGWVHAVQTPEDSIVFGGNFLHSFAIRQQVEVMMLEERTFVAASMRFPLAHELMWRICLLITSALSSRIASQIPQWFGGEVQYNSMRTHLIRLLEKTEAPDWVLDPPLLLSCFKDSLDGFDTTIDGICPDKVPIKVGSLATVELSAPNWYNHTVCRLSSLEDNKLLQQASLEFKIAYQAAEDKRKKKGTTKNERKLKELLPTQLVLGQIVRAKFQRSAMHYCGVVVAIPETVSNKIDKPTLKPGREEYSIWFEDGDFDPKVRRENIKGFFLDEENWVEKRLDVLRRLQTMNQKKSSQKRSRPPPVEKTWPFSFPTNSLEGQGVKKHRAGSRLTPFKAVFIDTLTAKISEGATIVAAHEEAKGALLSQINQLKVMLELPPSRSLVSTSITTS